MRHHTHACSIVTFELVKMQAETDSKASFYAMMEVIGNKKRKFMHKRYMHAAQTKFGLFEKVQDLILLDNFNPTRTITISTQPELYSLSHLMALSSPNESSAARWWTGCFDKRFTFFHSFNLFTEPTPQWLSSGVSNLFETANYFLCTD